MYEIDKNIPIPERCKNSDRKTKYPFGTMEVGDSFFVPCSKESRRRIANSLLANGNGRMKPKKFSTRVEAEGVRCWRIE